MDFNSIQFPIIKKVDDKLISDNLIGMKPGESLNDATERFLLEQRLKKIEKIIKRMNEPYV